MSDALAVTLLGGDLTAAAAALRSGRISSVALTRAAIERAQQVQARCRAFLEIEVEPALAAAERADVALDAARRSGREPESELLGIPLAHKDMFDRAGRVLRYGSRVLDDHRPHDCATVIARLEQAGAVTLGSLHMAEFALGATGHNAAFGDAANAWDPAYIAGGSSSGSGVAVAGGAVFGSFGSDTGGSVRIPASVNGVFGLKPTYGLIPRTGSLKLAPSIDVIGPVARSARDLAVLLAAVAGGDGRDALASRRSVPDYLRGLDHGIAGVRIGIPTTYFLEGLDADVEAALGQTRREWREAGAVEVPVAIPLVETFAELSRAVVYSEATALHANWLRSRPERYTPQVRLRASTGLGIPAPVYLEALQWRPVLLERVVREVFGRCDVLLTPTLPITVPRREDTDVGAGESLWAILSQLVRCTAPLNYLGLPALSLPIGCDRRGLPIGAQLVGRPFAEAMLLQIAALPLTSVSAQA